MPPKRKRFSEFDYYSILHVPKNATFNQIKKTYKKMCILMHPDKHRGDKFAEECFKTVAEAYEVLSDPKSKEIYDRTIGNLASKEAIEYQKNKIVFPSSMWIGLDKIRRKEPFEEEEIGLYGEERYGNFELFLGVTLVDMDACEYARQRILKSNPALIHIPCQARADSSLRVADLDKMIEEYENDSSGRALNKVFIFPKEISIYRIYPDNASEKGWNPKKATSEHPGTILSIIFSKEINEWKEKMSSRFVKMHQQYVGEYGRLQKHF